MTKKVWKREKKKPSPLGERIRALRESAGIEAEELSLAAGLSRTHVHSIEVGWILNPRFETVAEIANLLGVTLEHLAEGKGQPPAGSKIKKRFSAMRGAWACTTTT